MMVSMLVGSAGFTELSLDGKRVSTRVPVSGTKPLEHFYHFAVAAAQFDGACLEVFAIAAEYNGPEIECLNGVCGDRDGNLDLASHKFGGDEHARPPSPIPVFKNDA